MTPPPKSLLVANIMMMLLALLTMPYGYYQLLRLVTFASTGWSGAYFWREERQIAAVVAGIIALLFNPFIPVALDRETWSVINVGAAGVLALCLVLLRPLRSTSQQ
jgi:hypothetical protein